MDNETDALLTVDLEHRLTSPELTSTTAMEKIYQLYLHLPPEKQTVFGAIMTYVYLSMIMHPEKLPEKVQQIQEILVQLPLGTVSLWTAVLIAFAGTADGARRVMVERLPFYKAYIQAFVLHTDFSEEENE